jgi:hypothetical protein
MMVYLYQEKIAPPGPLRASPKPPDVLTLQLTIKSLKQKTHGSKNTLLVLFEISNGTSLATRRGLPSAGRARAEDRLEQCFFGSVVR